MPYTMWPNALLCLSILTGFGVQGVKALLGTRAETAPINFIAVVLSAVLSALAWLIYAPADGFVWPQSAIEFAFFIYLNFIVTTVGYDKVAQGLEQFRKGM